MKRMIAIREPKDLSGDHAMQAFLTAGKALAAVNFAEIGQDPAAAITRPGIKFVKSLSIVSGNTAKCESDEILRATLLDQTPLDNTEKKNIACGFENERVDCSGNILKYFETRFAKKSFIKKVFRNLEVLRIYLAEIIMKTFSGILNARDIEQYSLAALSISKSVYSFKYPGKISVPSYRATRL